MMPTFIFDENLLEKAIFIFVGSVFIAGLCFSILGDIWEGVKELMEAVWDSALEAFGGCDIADLEGGTFLEQIAKVLKKACEVYSKEIFHSWVWFFHIGPALVLGLGGIVLPVYKIVREFLSIRQWASFLGFSYYELILQLISHSWNNLNFWVQGSLRYLFILYCVTVIWIWFLEFWFFFTLLSIRFKKKSSA